MLAEQHFVGDGSKEPSLMPFTGASTRDVQAT